jgi:predicted nicotinamide N-methyase
MNSVDATGFCTWSSGKLLASMLLAEPKLYFGTPQNAPIRILELGSGTGLAGIAASKACELLQFEAEVHFTDYDESTLTTLQENVSANLAAVPKHQHSVRKLDWRDYLDAARVTAEEPFDIILGADIIYEREHGRLVCSVVRKLLRNEGVFHLVIPLRYTHAADVTAFEEELRSSGLQAMDIRQLDKGEGQYAHRYYRIRRMQK